MTEQRASANDTGLTAEQIMTDAQTDAFYLQGVISGIEIILAGHNVDQRKADGAIHSLVHAAAELAGKLGNDLDSTNIGRKLA